MVSTIRETKSLVIHLIDIFDVNGTLLRNLTRIIGSNPVILVGNKLDLLPKSTNRNKLKNWLFHLAEEEDTLNLGKNAKSSMLIEQDTGMVLYEKNAHEKLPPASMTKVMTLLLVMEAIENNKLGWDEKITVSEYASSMGGSKIC